MSEPAGAVSGSRREPIDRADVEALIVSSYPGLRLLMQRRAGDPQLAADLLNDAVCTTWEKWQAGRIERPEQIAGYVFQVALNLLRNQRRMAGERADLRAPVAALEALPGGLDPVDSSIEDGIARSVKELLAGMASVRDRCVLTRLYLDEEDKESICSALGLTPQQFDKIVHRARGRLRKLLESQGLRSRDFFSMLMVV
ncbi:MAG TPA: sigma-70 family RNA polymerase sigma factor [Steroidobacteraceae bacterium]|nr:sigma-70 family RNA polymerase sigma factor [Steroidobacteraceae bacterium]